LVRYGRSDSPQLIDPDSGFEAGGLKFVSDHVLDIGQPPLIRGEPA
jgi:hypothetical protein